MTDRQKFWLKVFLAVTLPLWFLPAIVVAGVALLGHLSWQIVSDIVEPRRHDDATDDGP